ncbi:Pectinesterase [Rhynchospora pubera]|uniref:Pectinesterase n=1 Tax=Rhynchospora pubera TaxID=906938 RepID=A0AAV8FPH6_9POAL|nr:Pectinesterase [Rhynchospora pubera]
MSNLPLLFFFSLSLFFFWGNLELVDTTSSKEMQPKRILVAWVCAIFTILIVSKATTASDTNATSTAATAVDDICKTTEHPDACVSALASAAGNPTASNQDYFDVSVQFALKRVESARAMAYNFSNAGQTGSSSQPSGMDDCLELLDISLKQLNDVIKPKKGTNQEDISTWLSAALTNQVTCSESLQMVPSSQSRDAMDVQVQSLAKYISTALALHVRLKGASSDTSTSQTGNRRLLSDNLPAWLSADDRRLLLASPADIQADAVVALDGTGTHTSITEAIAFVTSRFATDADGGGSSSRSTIYVKSGTYSEILRITNKQTNVMLMGDGKGKSIVVGSRSAGDGYSTYESATVAALGSGFMAKGLTIINKAGPAKHQAVALRVGSDKAVVYQCSIQGYQDTLYVHSNRQFIAETDIYGTVDFIFGNAVAVIQNCYIQPLKPSGGQHDTITAQGRTDPNQNTGISIHKCRIMGASNLGGTAVYLGRPWQKYSRTVVMMTYLDDSIRPEGWDKWSGNFALSTLYYGEYGNTGPGSSISGRVKWGGVHSSMSTNEASKFTVGNFIFGDEWLPSGVSYTSGL